MKGKDFLNSKWCKKASSPQTQESIKTNFNKWSTKIKNTTLLERAKQLYQYFISPDISVSKKIIVGGAILYIVAPLDIIPDMVPILGWLDDIGVATFALNYIFSQMDSLERKKLEKEIDSEIIIDQQNEDMLLNKEISGTNKNIFALKKAQTPELNFKFTKKQK